MYFYTVYVLLYCTYWPPLALPRTCPGRSHPALLAAGSPATFEHAAWHAWLLSGQCHRRFLLWAFWKRSTRWKLPGYGHCRVAGRRGVQLRVRQVPMLTPCTSISGGRYYTILKGSGRSTCCGWSRALHMALFPMASIESIMPTTLFGRF